MTNRKVDALGLQAPTAHDRVQLGKTGCWLAEEDRACGLAPPSRVAVSDYSWDLVHICPLHITGGDLAAASAE